MTIREFFDKWEGNSCDFDGYLGFQCMDLAEQYNKEVICAPRIGGNAIDVWKNFPREYYSQIANTADNFPVEGDLIIWNANIGNGFGHIAICAKADVNAFTSFDQNWPAGSKCHFQGHNYVNVIGWLHPNNIPMVSVPAGKFEELVGKATEKDRFDAAGYHKLEDVLQKVGELENEKVELTKDIESLKTQLADAVASQQKVHEEDLAAIEQSLEAQHKAQALTEFKTSLLQWLELPSDASDKQVYDKVAELKAPHETLSKEATKLVKALEDCEAKRQKVWTFGDWLKLGWNILMQKLEEVRAKYAK